MSVRRFLSHELATARGVAHDLEHDPTKQWILHRRMTWFWLVMFLPTLALGIVDIMGWIPGRVATPSLLMWNLLMSNYANFATEFDAVAAADAARKAGPE